jgi:dTDP-4-dehydrorhamnose reductase
MRVAVIGARGQLGSDLVRVLQSTDGYEVVPLPHDQIDVTDAELVKQTLDGLRPSVVINCSAYHRVDDCEGDAERAFRVNALGCLNVARASEALDAVSVYISSDYVFDGEKGASYVEEDVPAPLNVYGVSKVTGELLLRQTCRRWIVARMASLFGLAGASGKGGNFVETIRARAVQGQPLRVVDDIRMSPTYTADAAAALERLLAEGAEGVFHLTNAGSTSWYGFARKIVELNGLDADLEPTSSVDQETAARRPRDSSLASSRTPEAVRHPLREWEDALKRYLADKGHI